MTKKTTAINARKNLGQLLEQAYYRGDEFVIERAGKPMAALIPIQEFKQWQSQREKDFTRLEQAKQKMPKVPPGEVEKNIDQAIKKVRKKSA